MSEFTGWGRTNSIDFGDYVKYPNGCCRDMHIYKVVGALKSNGYQDAPDVFNNTLTLHSDIVPCLNIIHCGIDETRVIRVRESDCRLIKRSGEDAV